jgi:hypothetical protein
MIPDDQLFDIEGSVRGAFGAALLELGIAWVESRDSDQIVSPYAEIGATVTESTGHESIDGMGYSVTDRWTVDLRIIVATSRSVNPGHHSPMLAKIRGLLARPFRKSLEMTYHELLNVKENGSQTEISEEDDFDLTTVHATLMVGLKPHTLL